MKSSSKFSNYSKYSFARPITTERTKFSNPYQTFSPATFKEAHAVEIDIKQANLLVLDIDIKEDDAYLRERTFAVISEQIDLTNAFIEYSMNDGLHIYFKAFSVPESKIVYSIGSSEYKIELLNYKVALTNKAHNKSEYFTFDEFYSNAKPLTAAQQAEIITFLDSTFTNSVKASMTKEQRIEINKTYRGCTHYRATILSKIGVEKVLKYFSIKYKEASRYYTFFSLLEDDGNKPGAIIYKDSGIVVDFHTGQQYDFLTYFGGGENPKEVAKKILKHYNVPILKEKDEFVCTPKFNKMKINGHITKKTIGSILNAAKDKTNINIKAPTGSGKTTAIMEYAFDHPEINILFTEPYRAQIEQLEKTYDRPGVLFLYEGKSFTEEEYDNAHLIISTYDSIFKIPPAKEFKYIVIDEAHNIRLQKDFRYHALNKLQEYVADHSINIIYLTATPECLFYSEDSYNVEILCDINIKPKATYHVANKNEDILVQNIIDTHTKNKIDVVFINNITKMYILQDELEAHKLHTAIVFSKQNKPAPEELIELDSVINDSRFTGQYDVILTTIVLCDGVNINNDNIGNVHIYSNLSVIQVIQAYSRFRRGLDNLYIYKSNPLQNISRLSFNYDVLYKEAFNEANVITTSANGTVCGIDIFDPPQSELFKNALLCYTEKSVTNPNIFAVWNPNRYIRYTKDNKYNINTEKIKDDIYYVYIKITNKYPSLTFKDIKELVITNPPKGGLKQKCKDAIKAVADFLKGMFKQAPVLFHIIAKLTLTEDKTPYEYQHVYVETENDELKDAAITLVARYFKWIRPLMHRFLLIMEYIDLPTFFKHNEILNIIFAGNSAFIKYLKCLKFSSQYYYYQFLKRNGGVDLEHIENSAYIKAMTPALEYINNTPMDKKSAIEYLSQTYGFDKKELKYIICSTKKKVRTKTGSFHVAKFNLIEYANNEDVFITKLERTYSAAYKTSLNASTYDMIYNPASILKIAS